MTATVSENTAVPANKLRYVFLINIPPYFAKVYLKLAYELTLSGKKLLGHINYSDNSIIYF